MLGITVFARAGILAYFALGYDDLPTRWRTAWPGVLRLLLIGKLISTVACYGLGGCGGIFSPNLFFGGMCGVVVAGWAAISFR